MRGPTPKPEDRRQRRNIRAVVPIEAARSVRPGDVPEPPAQLLKSTREEWAVFWASTVATALDRSSDMPAVERLFLLRDDRARAHRGYRRSPLITGSTGQLVLNPLAGVVKSCDAEIRALEDRLGLNPMARLRIGMQIADTKKSLNALTEDLAPTFDTPDDDDGPALTDEIAVG